MRPRQWGQALFCFLFVIGLAARAEAARLQTLRSRPRRLARGVLCRQGKGLLPGRRSGCGGDPDERRHRYSSADCRRCRREHGWRIRPAADLSRRSAANGFHQFR